MKYLLLGQILLVLVALAGGRTTSCELVDKNIVARTASALAQVSNVGDIEITRSVPARAFPITPRGKAPMGFERRTKSHATVANR